MNQNAHSNRDALSKENRKEEQHHWQKMNNHINHDTRIEYIIVSDENLECFYFLFDLSVGDLRKQILTFTSS